MNFWKSLLIDILYVGTAFFSYTYTGFEFTIIIALGLILSNIIKLSYKPKSKPPVSIYTKNTKRFKI